MLGIAKMIKWSDGREREAEGCLHNEERGNGGSKVVRNSSNATYDHGEVLAYAATKAQVWVDVPAAARVLLPPTARQKSLI